MNKAIILKYLVLLSVISQMGCNNCDTTDEGDFKLTTEDLHIVPYNGTETLKFKNQAGDSIIFYGAGRHSDLDERYGGCDYNTDCCDYIYNIEIEWTIFAASNNSRIYIRLEKDRYALNHFSINIKCSENLVFNYSESLKFNANNIYCSSSYILTPYDTLTIAGKEFYSVYEFTTNNCDGPALPTVCYSLTQGIVGFKTLENESWYLYN